MPRPTAVLTTKTGSGSLASCARKMSLIGSTTVFLDQPLGQTHTQDAFDARIPPADSVGRDFRIRSTVFQFPSERGSRIRIPSWLPWVTVLLVAALLRFLGIGSASLWVDEANTYRIAAAELAEQRRLLWNDSSPPAYYLLLHAWMAVAGTSEAALRTLSALIALLLVAAVYALGRARLSDRVAFHAAWIVALSPAQIFYSQQARMYPLLALACLLSTWCLVRCVEIPRPGRAAAYLLVTSLAILTHNFALFLLPLHVGLVFFSGSLRRNLGFWSAVAAVVLLAFSPWLPILFQQIKAPDTYSWFEPQWRRMGWGTPLMATLHSFSATGHFIYFYFGEKSFLSGSNLPTFAFLALAFLAVAKSDGSGCDCRVPPRIWIGGLVAIPLLLSLATSWLFIPNYVPGRVDQAVYPAYALLVAMGIVRVRWPWARVSFVLAVFLLGVIGSTRVSSESRGDRVLATDIVGVHRNGDVIVCTSLTRASLDYYLERAGVDAEVVSFPASTAEHLGGQDDALLLRNRSALVDEASALVERLSTALGPDTHLILVLTEAEVNEPLLGALEQARWLEHEREVGRYVQSGTGIDVAVHEYGRGPESR